MDGRARGGGIGPRATRRRLAWVALLLILVAFASGCWDRLEIEDRAAVLAIGIDAAPGGGLHVSVQVGIPGEISLGPGGTGAGGGAPRPRETVFVTAGDGPDVASAMAAVQNTLNNQLFLGHVRIIAISQDLARQSIAPLVDYFHRNAEIRRTSWLLITQGPASDAIAAAPAFSRVPALFFSDMMDHAVNMGVLPPIFFGNYLAASAGTGSDALVPYIWAKGQGSDLLGAALFAHQRLVGTLTMAQLESVENVIGPRKAHEMVEVAMPGHPNDIVTLQIIGRRSSLRPQLQDGVPHMTVRVRMEANVVQEIGGDTLHQPNALQQLDTAAEAQLEQGVEQVLAYTQALGADAFGFGEQFRGKLPRFFLGTVRDKTAWEQRFYPELQASVTVRLLIRRVGMENR